MGSVTSPGEPVSLNFPVIRSKGEMCITFMTLFDAESCFFFSLPFTNPWLELRPGLSVIIGSQGQTIAGWAALHQAASLKSLSKLDCFSLQTLLSSFLVWIDPNLIVSSG